MTPRLEEWYYTGSVLRRRGRSEMSMTGNPVIPNPTARFDPLGNTRPIGGESVGVIPGISRTTVNGNLILDSTYSGTGDNPTVIENLDVTGYVSTTTASNIVVRNVKARGGPPVTSSGAAMVPPQTGNYPLFRFWGTGTNVVFEDFEADPSDPSLYTYGIHMSQFVTLRRFWVHDCTDGIVTFGPNGSRQEGGLVNRMRWYQNDPNQASSSDPNTHNDPWQAEGGGGTLGHKAFGVEYDISPGPSGRLSTGFGSGYSVLGTQNNAVSQNFELGNCWFVGNTTFSNLQWGDSGKGAWINPSVHDCRFLGTFGTGGHGYMRISDLTLAALAFDRNTGPSGEPIAKASSVVGATAQR